MVKQRKIGAHISPHKRATSRKNKRKCINPNPNSAVTKQKKQGEFEFGSNRNRTNKFLSLLRCIIKGKGQVHNYFFAVVQNGSFE